MLPCVWMVRLGEEKDVHKMQTLRSIRSPLKRTCFSNLLRMTPLSMNPSVTIRGAVPESDSQVFHKQNHLDRHLLVDLAQVQAALAFIIHPQIRAIPISPLLIRTPPDHQGKVRLPPCETTQLSIGLTLHRHTL